MLNWANRFNIFLFLDSHGYKDKYGEEEWILALDAIDEFKPGGDVLIQLSTWLNKTKDWKFGHVSYDLKNEIEELHSQHEDHIGFPDTYFFQPAIVIRKKGDAVEIQSATIAPGDIFTGITSNHVSPRESFAPHIQARFSKEEYIRVIEKLQQHILRGDCYEINFCQ
jgi:para-aminobenzoate synthetase component 1